MKAYNALILATLCLSTSLAQPTIVSAVAIKATPTSITASNTDVANNTISVNVRPSNSSAIPTLISANTAEVTISAVDNAVTISTEGVSASTAGIIEVDDDRVYIAETEDSTNRKELRVLPSTAVASVEAVIGVVSVATIDLDIIEEQPTYTIKSVKNISQGISEEVESNVDAEAGSVSITSSLISINPGVSVRLNSTGDFVKINNEVINATTSNPTISISAVSSDSTTKQVIIQRASGALKIKTENIEAVTTREVKYDNSSLYLIKEQEQYLISVTPDVVKENIESTAGTVTNISVDVAEDKAEYQVRSTKTTNLFGFIPINMTVNSKVNAESGEITSVNKPWWSFLTIG